MLNVNVFADGQKATGSPECHRTQFLRLTIRLFTFILSAVKRILSFAKLQVWLQETENTSSARTEMSVKLSLDTDASNDRKHSYLKSSS